MPPPAPKICSIDRRVAVDDSPQAEAIATLNILKRQNEIMV